MIKCCNHEIKIQKADTLWWAKCPKCGKGFKHADKKEVEKFFQEEELKTYKPPAMGPSKIMTVIPKIPVKPKESDIIKWENENYYLIESQSTAIQNKPALKRMIRKNSLYLARLADNKSYDKIFSIPDGVSSITEAYLEACYYGATLGEMGDIVPFGQFAEFIGNIELYKFALETGKNAPFRDIQIDIVYENDKTDNYQEDGNFYFKFIKRGIPRGEPIAVVVSGVRTDVDKKIGDIYDFDRLIEKAKRHSPSYKAYLKQKEEFQLLKTSGKLDKDKAGRECIKKTGKFGDYYIYEDDISNPYDGPDRPEMLRKSAGKSFFAPYMKVRNALAMAEECDIEEPENREQAADNILNQALNQFDGVDITDAEIVEDDEAEKELKPENKKEEQKSNGNLFND